jgi:membrane protease YdiL (CAAX protease family)
MTFRLPPTTRLDLLLFVFLLVIAPAWDYYDTQRLNRNPTSKKRLWYYKTLCLWLWIAALIACSSPSWTWALYMARHYASLLFQHAWEYYVVVPVVALFTAAIVLPYATVLWMWANHKPRKHASAELLQKISYAYLFPATRTERRWWIVVALTAGICEEILFRGFLMYYLFTKFGQSAAFAVVGSCVVFGLQHLYQGGKGVVTTALIGAIFALSFALSGSLLLPIILHALTDLRLLVMLKPATE